MNKRNLIVIALFIVILIGGFLWWQSSQQERGGGYTGPVEKVAVSLKWLHQAQFAGLYVAKQKGFYQDAGLDVDIIEWDFVRRQEDDLASGAHQFAVLNPIEMIKAVDKGLGFRAVAVIYQDAAYALIASKESGITTPADFRGKVLGNKGGTDDGKIIFPALLKAYGVDESDVTYVDTGFDTHEVDDIIAKTVDVSDLYRTDQVYLFDEQGVEYNLILPERFGFEMNGDVIVTTQRLIDENPDLVKRFVQATIKGWQYAVSHPEEAVDITIPFVTNDTYKDRDLEKFILESSIPLIQPSGPGKIGNMQFVRWKTLYEAMQANGLLENEFDVNDVFTRKFLR